MFSIESGASNLFEDKFQIKIHGKGIHDYDIILATLSIPHYGGQYLPETNAEISSVNYDIFLHLTSQQISNLKSNKNTFFIFDFTLEGESYKYYNFYQLLTLSAIKHNIPCEKIFFLSSNLLEEQAYQSWQVANFPNNKINVVSFNIWDDKLFSRYFYNFNYIKKWNIDSIVSRFRETKTKNFLCLNRRKRNFRMMTIYKILKSNILDQTLLSHDHMTDQEIVNLSSWTSEYQRRIPYEELKLVLGSTRLLDRNDFEINWATSMPDELFDNALISTVSETLHDTFDNTSLFYSEKTFKPMMYLQPIFIFGQPGINTHFEKIGYRTYKNYFNLDFDTIENPVDRINSQIKQLEMLNDQLSSMSQEQKLEWYLQDRETIEHNRSMIVEQQFNKSKYTEFMKLLHSLSQ